MREVAWSPDSKYFASGGDDVTVQVWDAVTGKQRYTYTGHMDDVRSVSWSPIGKYIASGSHDGTVQVWEIVNGSRRLYINQSRKFGVNAVIWSSDALPIASGEEGTIQITHIDTAHVLYVYRKHLDIIYCLSWSPNGLLIASGWKCQNSAEDLAWSSRVRYACGK